MGRCWHLKFDDGQEIEVEGKLWPVNSPLPLKDLLAYEREFHQSPWVFLRPFDNLQEVPASFYLFFAWRELQRQQPRLAGKDWVAFCERLVEFEDRTTYPDAEPDTAQAAEEGEGTPDPPGAQQKAS